MVNKILHEILLFPIEKKCMSSRVCVCVYIVYVYKFELAQNLMGTYHFLSDVVVPCASLLGDSKF